MLRDEASPNGSNGSSPDENVETGYSTLEIDGEQFSVRETDSEIEVIIPDDLPEEKRADLENKADEFKHTLASAKRKAFEAKREKEDVERARQELEQEREALRKEREAINSRKPKISNTDDNALLRAFGVETWDEVSQLQVENPAEYHNGLARYNAERSATDAYNRLRDEAINNTIINDGFNPNTVAAFAKAKGISSLEVAYDYYKRVTDKPKGISLAEIQKKAVKLVPKGSAQPKAPAKTEGMKEIYNSIEK